MRQILDHVTCELHEGAICFRGGDMFPAWTCPACELERLHLKVARLHQKLEAMPPASSL